MLAVGKRQRDLLTVSGERREDGQGQFDGLESCLRTAEGLTLFRDRGQEVTNGAMMAAVDESDVLRPP